MIPTAFVLILLLAKEKPSLASIEIPNIGDDVPAATKALPDLHQERNTEGGMDPDTWWADGKGGTIGGAKIRLVRLATAHGHVARISIPYQAKPGVLKATFDQVEKALRQELGQPAKTGGCWSMWQMDGHVVAHIPWSVLLIAGDVEKDAPEISRLSQCLGSQYDPGLTTPPQQPHE
jgi:hypothetical protein